MKRILLFNLTLLFTFLLIFSNNLSAQGNKEIIRCYTVEMDKKRKSKGVSNYKTDEQFEKWLAPKVQEVKEQMKNGRRAVITLPVVVHVIHDGDPVNSNGASTNENISDAQVFSQITVLNEDFRKLPGTPGDGSGVDTEIEFCLAQTDPNGNSTNGINRVNLGQASWDGAAVEGTLKPSTIWNPEEYLNIWVCRFGGDLDGVLGYAQFPAGSGLAGLCADGDDPNTDGLIMSYQYFGSSDYDDGTFVFSAPYDKGRTTTHEIGHGLGLRHIWGDGACGVDDFCADTPESDASNFGCPTGHVSCSSVDQIENYMDYTDDTCMDMFTADQKARMIAVLTNSDRRKNLLTSTKCQIPSPRITFVDYSTSTIEGTSCGSTTDIAVELAIETPPSANADLTLNFAGSAVNGTDYTVTPSVVTFPSGSSANQTFTISIEQDADQELDEDIIITYSLNNNGGNAIIGNASKQSFTINVKEDDNAPISTTDIVTDELFAENWDDVGDASAWTYDPAVAEKRNFWYILDDGCGEGIDCNTAQILHVDRVMGQWSLYCSYGSFAGAIDITSPAFSTVGYTGLTVNFDWKCAGSGDFGEVIYSTDGGGSWTATGNFSGQATTQAASVAIPDGVTNIGFRFTDNGTGTSSPGFNVDNIVVQGNRIPSEIQTVVNTGGAVDEKDLGPNQTVHFYDQTTGDIMATIENLGGHDYGCTKVEVVTQGNVTQVSPNIPIVEDITSKTFLVTPEFNSALGANLYKITLYYTAAEVNGFTTNNGNTITGGIIVMAKGPGSIASSINEVEPATPVAWGNDFTLTATFDSGFSGFGGGDDAGLPVELLDFTALAQERSVQLDWTTASEINNKGFEVERSLNIDSGFRNIGFVKGNGTTTEQQNYTFNDSDVRKGVTYYYRLKQVDLDGAYDYSDVVSASLKGKGMDISLLPNPTKDLVNVFVVNAVKENIQINVYNIQGQVVLNRRVTIRENNMIELDIKDLTSGVYMLKVGDEMNYIIKKLIVK